MTHLAPKPGHVRWRFCLERLGAWVFTGALGLLGGYGNHSDRSSLWGLAPAPDGKTVYFVAGPPARCNVLALDLASGNTRVVSKLEKYVGDPVCSQEGKWLLLTGGAAGGRGQIVRLDLMSGKVKPFVVSAASDTAPSLSRDNETLAFVQYVRQYRHGFGGAGWTDGDVWVGKIRSRSYRQVTQEKAIWIGSGVFLPDDRHLMLSMDTGGKMNLYLLDLANGTMKQLTHVGDHNRDPALSPDGTMVVFSSDRAEKYCSELWRMRPDGSGAQQITHLGRRCREAKFLPNGRSVVFLIDHEIWRADVDGTNLRKLYQVTEPQERPE